MLVDIGKGEYRNLWDMPDYLRVVEEKTSYEFVRVIEEKLNDVEQYIQDSIDDYKLGSDLTYIEAENEELRDLLDDVNSTLQNFIEPIEQGGRLNREKTIKMLNDVIKKLSSRC